MVTSRRIRTCLRKASEPKATKSKSPSPFFLYMRQLRPLIVDENPEATVTEVARKAGDEWNKLSDAEKSRWKKEGAMLTPRSRRGGYA